MAQDSINTGTTFVCDSTNFSIAILWCNMEFNVIVLNSKELQIVWHLNLLVHMGESLKFSKS